ncbi:MAG: hypothetical protein KC776_26395 [Myxococcales bacterium]|nr:hypothetical protein [Myxococcales bacterium]MCB9582954.1 hypothetical protein [Polyangiaceae bacterium]
MTAPRVPLGELLVEAQIITREQLEEVLELQKSDGRRLGTLLVETGVVTETQVTQILSQQLSVPWVSLYHIDFSRQLLNLVPRELAERHCLVPIFVRRVRGQGNTLYVAMDDPANQAAQQDIQQFAGLPVRAMIAPPSDILSAIRVYYGGGGERSASLSEAEAEVASEARPEPRGESSEPPPKPVSTPPMAKSTSEPPERTSEPPGRTSEPPEAQPPGPAALREAVLRPRTETPPPESAPAISAREVHMPAPKRGAPGRMITLTLLDGTQVNLPAKRAASTTSSEEAAPGADLTARDLVAALRAVAHGADATEILGENVRWEALFAALLSLLLKKHLIADWEFVEEYKKI